MAKKKKGIPAYVTEGQQRRWRKDPIGMRRAMAFGQVRALARLAPDDPNLVRDLELVVAEGRAEAEGVEA
jgi:hypothetical protein